MTTPNPLPDDALALRAKLVAALHGHTKYSRDVTLTGEWLTEQIWPVITPFISRLEAAETRAAAAEAERDAMRATLHDVSVNRF